MTREEILAAAASCFKSFKEFQLILPEDQPGHNCMKELILKDSSYKSIYGPDLMAFQEAIGRKDVFIGLKLGGDGYYINITW